MPPIINSDSTGRVTKKTRDIFIECSGFDQDVLDKLLNIIVCSLADERGVIHSVEVYFPKSQTTQTHTNLMPNSTLVVNESAVQLNMLGATARIWIIAALGLLALAFGAAKGSQQQSATTISNN